MKSDLLIGIVSGTISGIIVSKIFASVQNYLDEYRQLTVLSLKIYRLNMYLRVVVNDAVKRETYELDNKRPIRKIDDYSKKTCFINKVYEEIREEDLFSKYNYCRFEDFRNEVKNVFLHEIEDTGNCTVADLEHMMEGIDGLLERVKKIQTGKTGDIMELLIKDKVLWAFLLGIILLVAFSV